MSTARRSDWSRVVSRFALALGMFLGLAWVFHSRDQLLDQDRETRAAIAGFERALAAELLRPVLALQLQEYRAESERLSGWLPAVESEEWLREILSRALTEHQVSPEQLRIEPAVEHEFVVERVVSMEFAASADQLWRVLDDVGNSAPMKRLQSLEVMPDPDQVTALRIASVWVVYSYREEGGDEQKR